MDSKTDKIPKESKIAPDNDRRVFLRGASLTSMAALLGVSAIPYHRNMPQGLIPVALADDIDANPIDGKDALTVHNDRPVNAEPAPHLLDDRITPTKAHFVRLADVLKAAGVKDSVVYTAHESADTHLSGKPGKLPISRGVPIAKAMDPNILIAFAQNGKPIHPMNGAPLRLVVPGWPGSCSQKWLTRIWLRDQIHDGPKMTGTAYRVPKKKVAPGTKVDKKDFEIIEAMPVKSLITHPATDLKTHDNQIAVRGHTWAGDRTIKAVHISKDFGATWQKAELEKPANGGAWQHWNAKVNLSEPGYYEVWARATDDHDVSQPFAINWNPKGYLNNSVHRISVNRI